MNALSLSEGKLRRSLFKYLLMRITLVIAVPVIYKIAGTLYNFTQQIYTFGIALFTEWTL